MKLSIPLAPMGKQRPRLGGKRVHMPPAYMHWKRVFAWHARSQWRGPMIDGTFTVSTTFTTPTGNTQSDLDNAHSACLDALQGVAYKNDKSARSGAYAIRKGDEFMITVEVLGIGAGPIT